MYENLKEKPMSYYLNYKFKLKSGPIYESDNGGYQGAPRDAFLEGYENKPKHLTERSQFDECSKNLNNVRSFDVLLFGDFPEDVSNHFKMGDHYDGTVFKIDISLLDEKRIEDFLHLLDYTDRVEIDNDWEFLPVERDAFRLANIEENFKDANMSDPAVGLLLSIRKRWFIEYFTDNLLFGFRQDNIEYLDWSID